MCEIQTGDVLEKCNIIVSNIYECSFMWFEEDYRRFKINWTKLDKLNETNMKLSETDMKPPEIWVKQGEKVEFQPLNAVSCSCIYVQKG